MSTSKLLAEYIHAYINQSVSSWSLVGWCCWDDTDINVCGSTHQARFLKMKWNGMDWWVSKLKNVINMEDTWIWIPSCCAILLFAPLPMIDWAFENACVFPLVFLKNLSFGFSWCVDVCVWSWGCGGVEQLIKQASNFITLCIVFRIKRRLVGYCWCSFALLRVKS